jgi:Metallo-beta-lactamase superfamily
VRIHHLNCGSLCPRGGKLFGGAGGPLSPAPMCCHCLLIEGDDGLVLVDSGLGVEDVNEPRRLGFLFNTMVRPRLDVAETALRQVADLGFRPSDVRHIVPTHLDLDHAGGLSDFPDAAVHVFNAELRAASHRSSLMERNRYRKVQIAAVKTWAAVEEEGEFWFGFSAVRAIPGTRDEVLLIRYPDIRAGIAASRSGARTIGCSIAATRISITPKSRPTAVRRQKVCAFSSRWWSSMARRDAPIRRACASSQAPPQAR